MKNLAKKLHVDEKDINLVLTVYCAFFIIGITNTGIGSILPEMSKEYNMDYAFSGLIQSASQIGNLMAVLMSGFLSNIIGRKKTVTIFFIGVIIGMTMVSLTGNAIALIIAFTLIGVTRGSTNNISNVTISEVSKNADSSLNILHSLFAFGSVMTPIIVLILSKPFGWKGFTVFSVIVSIPILFALWKSNMPDEVAKKNSVKDYSFLKSVSFWLVTFTLFFYICVEMALIGWMVTYFKDEKILSESISQITLAILWIMIMVGRLTYAMIPKKINENTVLVISAVLQMFSFILIMLIPKPAIIILGIAILGLGSSVMYPTTLSTMEPQYASSPVATGTCIAISTLGGVIMPYLIGVVSDKKGIKWGMGTISIALILLILITVIKAVYEKKKV